MTRHRDDWEADELSCAQAEYEPDDEYTPDEEDGDDWPERADVLRDIYLRNAQRREEWLRKLPQVDAAK